MFKPTSSTVDAQILQTLRGLTPVRKLELAGGLNHMADQLALAGIQRRMPHASIAAQAYALVLQRLSPEQRAHGAALLEGKNFVSSPVDPLALAVRLGATLDQLAIPYVIVGSVAAVVHGEYRMTRDLDLVLQLTQRALPSLIEGLRASLTFLPSDIHDALARLPVARSDWRQRASFCAYDQATGFQIDLYLSAGRPFEVAQFHRAQALQIPGETGGLLRVASAEDTVLAKLEWYKLAPSERQWRDVQAILHVQDGLLDYGYLQQWAAKLGLEALLNWALKGQTPPSEPEPPQQQRLW